VWNATIQPPVQVARFGTSILKFTRDGTTMALFDWSNGRVETWNTLPVQKAASFRWDSAARSSPDFVMQDAKLSGDGRLLALTAIDEQRRFSRALDGVGQKLGIWDESGLKSSTQIWNAREGKLLAKFSETGVMSPDGRSLVTWNDKGFYLWELPPCRPIDYKLGLSFSVLLFPLLLIHWFLRRFARTQGI